MRALIFSLFVLFGLNLSWAEGKAEDAKLESFFKTYLDKSFRLQPMHATEMGDHRFDAELEDLTPQSRSRWLELARTTLADLPQQVDFQKLSGAGQIDFEILQHSLKADVWLTETFHPFEEDTRIY